MAQRHHHRALQWTTFTLDIGQMLMMNRRRRRTVVEDGEERVEEGVPLPLVCMTLVALIRRHRKAMVASTASCYPSYGFTISSADAELLGYPNDCVLPLQQRIHIQSPREYTTVQSSQISSDYPIVSDTLDAMADDDYHQTMAAIPSHKGTRTTTISDFHSIFYNRC